MSATQTKVAARELPVLDLPVRRQVALMQATFEGQEPIRAAGGKVVKLRLGPERLAGRWVAAFSPEAAHDMLTAGNGLFEKDDKLWRTLRQLGGKNLADLVQAEWRPRRRTLQPVFTKKQSATYTDQIYATAKQTVAELGDGGRVDLDPVTRRLSWRVLGQSIYGLDLGARTEELERPARDSVEYIVARAFAPVRLPGAIPTPARARFRRAMADLHAIADEAFDKHRAAGGGGGLVRLLDEATDPETGVGLTREAVRNELTMFLLAGSDATATTLAYALWALGRNPEMQERAAAEVRALGDRPLTPEDGEALPFTVQVIHEVMRLVPPIPAMSRLTTGEAEMAGYRVPEGTNVLLGIYAMHRDPDLWEDPLRFDPDRFAPERMAEADKWRYLPFGGGHRKCIGHHFAMLEIILSLATLLRELQFESLNAELPLEMPFTLVPAEPVIANVRRRD